MEDENVKRFNVTAFTFKFEASKFSHSLTWNFTTYTETLILIVTSYLNVPLKNYLKIR